MIFLSRSQTGTPLQANVMSQKLILVCWILILFVWISFEETVAFCGLKMWYPWILKKCSKVLSVNCWCANYLRHALILNRGSWEKRSTPIATGWNHVDCVMLPQKKHHTTVVWNQDRGTWMGGSDLKKSLCRAGYFTRMYHTWWPSIVGIPFRTCNFWWIHLQNQASIRCERMCIWFLWKNMYIYTYTCDYLCNPSIWASICTDRDANLSFHLDTMLPLWFGSCQSLPGRMRRSYQIWAAAMRILPWSRCTNRGSNFGFIERMWKGNKTKWWLKMFIETRD